MASSVAGLRSASSSRVMRVWRLSSGTTTDMSGAAAAYEHARQSTPIAERSEARARSGPRIVRDDGCNERDGRRTGLGANDRARIHLRRRLTKNGRRRAVELQMVPAREHDPLLGRAAEEAPRR